MARFLIATLVVIAAIAPARADRMAPIAKPSERALHTSIVVIGRVTAIEKDTVDATLYPGATQKIAYKIAVVKIQTNLVGAENTTHLKIGFVPVGRGGRKGPDNPELKEGEEWLFFATKHHSGEFYAIPYLTPPINATTESYKADVEAVKKILAAVNDPAKALKAEKAEDRYAAAVAVVYKFRAPPDGSTEKYEEVALTADESRPILKALAEGSWKANRAAESMSGYMVFMRLGLSEKDGWKPPAAQAGQDYTELTHEAFTKWLDGPGKEYRIKKLVPKK